jgi:hypothetical protein
MVHVASMGEKSNAYRVLIGKPEGKRRLGRLGLGGGIGIEWKGVDWIHLAQDLNQ